MNGKQKIYALLTIVILSLLTAAGFGLLSLGIDYLMMFLYIVLLCIPFIIFYLIINNSKKE